LPHREAFEVLTAQLVTLRITLYAHTPLNENVISFAVLKDQADALGVLDKEFERAVPEDLVRNSKNTREISDMIKKFYFADQHLSEAKLLPFVDVSMCKQLRLKFVSVYKLQRLMYMEI